MINSLDMGGSYFNPQKPCQKTGHKALNRLESLGLTEPGPGRKREGKNPKKTLTSPSSLASLSTPEDQNPFKRNSLCSSEELLPSRRRSSTSPATAAVRTSPRVVATPLFVALPRLFAELPLCFAVLLPPFHRASAALQPSSSSLGSSESKNHTIGLAHSKFAFALRNTVGLSRLFPQPKPKEKKDIWPHLAATALALLVEVESESNAVMEFCPTCGNMLQYEQPNLGRPSRFYCPTCPYVCHIENMVKIKRKQLLVRKEIEPVISQDDMKNAPTAEVPCPRCSHDKAAYTEFQTRSADEPATIFYLCLNEKCKHQWRED
ncbi:hypothetical protein HN51_014434 [Arachis hypogaea]